MRCEQCNLLFTELVNNEDGIPGCPRCGSDNVAKGTLRQRTASGIPRCDECPVPTECEDGCVAALCPCLRCFHWSNTRRTCAKGHRPPVGKCADLKV